MQHAVFHFPMRQELIVGFLLLLGQLFGVELRPLGQFDEALPVGEILAVEERGKAFWRRVVLGLLVLGAADNGGQGQR